MGFGGFTVLGLLDFFLLQLGVLNAVHFKY